jgi:hypothetical protein
MVCSRNLATPSEECNKVTTREGVTDVRDKIIRVYCDWFYLVHIVCVEMTGDAHVSPTPYDNPTTGYI